MKNLFIYYYYYYYYYFAQSIYLSSPLQISYYFALPIAQICSIPHSKSLSLFFLSLTHCPYFLSFPLQMSYFFPLTHSPKTTNTNSLKHTNINPQIPNPKPCLCRRDDNPQLGTTKPTSETKMGTEQKENLSFSQSGRSEL